MKYRELINAAFTARENAYAPYSKFFVGAALLTDTGEIFTGCNVENESFSLTNCAERTAFFKAISENRKTFTAIAIVGGKENEIDFCPPCGACRQVMSEFCDGAGFKIILAKSDDEWREYSLSELFPLSFDL